MAQRALVTYPRSHTKSVARQDPEPRPQGTQLLILLQGICTSAITDHKSTLDHHFSFVLALCGKVLVAGGLEGWLL